MLKKDASKQLQSYFPKFRKKPYPFQYVKLCAIFFTKAGFSLTHKLHKSLNVMIIRVAQKTTASACFGPKFVTPLDFVNISYFLECYDKTEKFLCQYWEK